MALTDAEIFLVQLLKLWLSTTFVKTQEKTMYKTDLKKPFRRLFVLGVLSAGLLFLTLPHPRVVYAKPCWECDVDYTNCRWDADAARNNCYSQLPPSEHYLCEAGHDLLLSMCWDNYGLCLGECTIEPRPGPTPGPTPGGGGEDSNCRARCGTQYRICRQNNDAEVCSPQYQECLSFCPD